MQWPEIVLIVIIFVTSFLDFEASNPIIYTKFGVVL